MSDQPLDLPDAHWGDATKPLPDWRQYDDGDDADPDDEELPETPQDVIDGLGFDPLELANAPAQDAYQEGEFEEGKHPRDESGKFTSGGGGAGAPTSTGGATLAQHADATPPPSKFTPTRTKMYHLVKSGLASGKAPQQIANQIHKLAANTANPAAAIYGNKLLAHIAKAHGLAHGALGLAAPKGKPATPPSSAMASPMPAPAAPSPPIPGVGPEPHAGSALQQEIHQIATDPANTDNANKIALIEMALEKSTGPHSKEFGNAWITALGGTPKAPAPPSAPPSGPTVATPNVKRLDRAKSQRAQAHDVASAGEPIAKTICPSLSRSWWPKVDQEGRSACISYKGGSGSINGLLRDDTSGPVQHTQAQINAIDELYEHPDARLKSDVVLRRGENVPAEQMEQWKAALGAGKLVRPQRKGFTSTSMASEAAFSLKNTIYEITARAGTPALGIWAADASFNSENEVLLRHGIAFDIYEIEQVGDRHIVRCTTL